MTERLSIPRVAAFGCGHWGKNIVRNLSELGALVALYDTNEAIAGEFADKFSVESADVQSILADESIEAVAIATPAVTHAELALKALAAGKHVFVEKPVALELEDARRVRDAAAAAGRVVMVGHLLQYHSAFLKLRELVRAGELGRLQHVYSHRLNLGKVRREENILWSFAPHDLSMILALVGSEPAEVSAIGSFFLHKEIADVTTTHLSFPGGEQAHVFVSWLHPYKEQKLVAVGDQGMAVFDDREPWDRKLLLYPHKILWRDGVPVPDKGVETPVEIDESEPLKDELRHFLQCVKGLEVCRTDADEAIRVLKVLQASERAMKSRQTLSLAAAARLAVAEAEPTFFVHESSYVDESVEIGRGTKIWHFSHILSGTQIGEDCVLSQNVMVGPNVRVGDRCKIQNNVSLYKGVILEEGVFCGPSCVFTNVNTPRAEIERKDEFAETLVRRGVTIGANATIVCGVELGEYCFIAAGATVTRDVRPFALMAGTPAKQIGWVSHSGEVLGADLVCPRTGTKYTLTPDAGLTTKTEALQHG